MNKAQAAIEYMLLLAVVVAIVIVGFKTFLPKGRTSSELFFNRVTVGILGDPPSCGDGTGCSGFKNCHNCPSECGCSCGDGLCSAGEEIGSPTECVTDCF